VRFSACSNFIEPLQKSQTIWDVSLIIQENVRHRLSEILVATVSLRLVRGKSGDQILPALEVMYTTSTIKACIRDGHLDEIEHHTEYHNFR
jgi:Tfp pilus assembly pilus retraction ATPase PilT